MIIALLSSDPERGCLSLLSISFDQDIKIKTHTHIHIHINSIIFSELHQLLSSPCLSRPVICIRNFCRSQVQMPGAQRVGTNLTQVTGPEPEEDDDPNRLPTFVKAQTMEPLLSPSYCPSLINLILKVLQRHFRFTLVCIDILIHIHIFILHIPALYI